MVTDLSRRTEETAAILQRRSSPAWEDGIVAAIKAGWERRGFATGPRHGRHADEEDPLLSVDP
jgi:hypothetical protein